MWGGAPAGQPRLAAAEPAIPDGPDQRAALYGNKQCQDGRCRVYTLDDLTYFTRADASLTKIALRVPVGRRTSYELTFGLWTISAVCH